MKKTKKATPRYVGLDVHKHEITACLLDEHGQQITTERFQLTRSRLRAFAQVRLTRHTEVALEATTNSWAVADLLRPYVKQVVVSNPMATKAIAQAKVKTDKVDAGVLAHLLRCDYLPRVWEPDAETKKMRQLSGRRAALVQQRTAICNRVHSVLAVRLIEAPENLFSRQGQQWLQKQLERGQLDDEGYVLITSDLALLEAVEKQIDRFDQLLAEHAWQEQRVRLLMTLPGVDVTVAESLLAALGDVSRFPTPDHAAGYLGLVPSMRQSAAKCYRGPITKQGNNQARWMLIQSAQAVARQGGPLGHFFQRLKRRKNHNVAVVAVARKLVVIAVHMLKNNEPYRYAQPKSTETKLARLRVRATGQKRRGGVPKGQKSKAKLPGGSRTVKSLDRVYAVENLPPRQPLAPGERRTVETHNCQEFVDSIAKDQIVPRRGKQPAQQN